MIKRREFLKITTSSIVAATIFPSMLKANQTEDDYKAIVVVLQLGGNDSVNMFIASDDSGTKESNPSGYKNYYHNRGALAVDNNDLSDKLNVDANGDLSLDIYNQPYASDEQSLTGSYLHGFYKHTNSNFEGKVATNAVMPEIAHLVNQNRVAVIANAGNLPYPMTKEDIATGIAQLPPFSMSHKHQRKLMFNGMASKLDAYGWAGRLADNWEGINGNSIYGLNIAVEESTHMFQGAKSESITVGQDGPSTYDKIDKTAFKAYLQNERRDVFKKLYNQIRVKSFSREEVLAEDWATKQPSFSGVKDCYGGDIFSKPLHQMLLEDSSFSISFSDRLSVISKMAYIGKAVGLKRQIFYIKHKNYDQHSNQIEVHPKLLREFSLGLGKFYKSIDALGMENNIVTMNISDFGRSVGFNGAGTDHAWGGHYMVIGGKENMKGGLYGTMPDLTLDGPDDFTHKGRLIPSTSMSQIYGTVLKWFGVNENILNTTLPELKNFTEVDLGFMG